MGVTAPLEVGTRGTVGSLVKKEIEYFRRFELVECGKNSVKSRKNFVDMASNGGDSWRGCGFLTWRKKKKKSRSGIQPSICSVVEVVEGDSLNGVSGFNYRSLKAEIFEA